ncbi:Glycerol-3-phosphate dehydrogenase [NAD(P)+] (EC 1.1.1.94) [uncultured Gammaproteobacteria bacterium]|uniref:NAD(P)H-dependent glycerol-3-phosphate dehydrogenase n=1 Tax=Bathymodiolus heckerae thiotrophic gill symbiont TaxID=1052212 RepID=UPI0010BB528B|nr:NAD(P)H-dependent glycerol-3-phosphate dehydrogenase [Bathymodiolus heckerae thiotrophic gill symbiont]CAC9534058.1 Glycerol-3-phosphate dehydrogenase [NAD(P)+] (EC 1.1.1.94) [uncultured Gammaproteobacteria bacterium]CAC9598927.1 Glycerol-3-phosphate dehydrogenase [NAD(P)+] (EC 1.1.1.94) [uncultured Gammaproteobacteria bacterium]CAC9966173.1 Glycerol-3-phosphate dehydrogenase [NAD(P)+] (EC 1.1.1.94) [uncultured Gammaproteobacteria bacterium]SHN89460.1 Glycerol-3-phosphate dehydrogenase [NAD(
MSNNLSIIGAGAWGSALAIALSDKFETIYLHAHTKDESQSLKPQHHALPKPYTSNIEIVHGYDAISRCHNILIASPSYAFSEVLKTLKPLLSKKHQIAWATKGFDTSAHCFLYQSFERILPDYHGCVLSGPSFAFEVASNKPTALVSASKDKATRKHWADLIRTKTLRAYTNEDIVGVEIGGSVKNILAIAAGIASGLGYGINTQAALITRGLAEMTRLGKSMGAKSSTFVGLSGLGDLVLTCSDDLSRNRRFGKELANDHNVQNALINVGATVEGLNTLDLILSIATEQKVEMPICEQVYYVTQGKISPIEAVNHLMSREQIDE